MKDKWPKSNTNNKNEIALLNYYKRTQSPPEQLKWPKHHNEVEWLHIKGKNNQAQERKHCYCEVKPGQRSTIKTSAWYLKINE